MSKANLLTTIDTDRGAQVDIAYAYSSNLKDTTGQYVNKRLPLGLDVVATTTERAGASTVTTAYRYGGGEYYYYDPFDRKFAGSSLGLAMHAFDAPAMALVKPIFPLAPSEPLAPRWQQERAVDVEQHDAGVTG